MEFLIIIILTIILLILLGYVFSINKKKILDTAKNEELDNIAKKYPNNIELCKKYLKKLKNENVKIEENKNQEASLYVAITNKIIIANVSNTYTRIQTIAHECLHSIQDRKVLIFNFIFSNIYLIYYIVICICALFNILSLQFKMIFLIIFLILGLVNYVIRMYLENDAMIKARFLAKEYLEEVKISDENEIKKIIENYDELNKVGIKCVNYSLYLTTIIPIILFCIVCFIYNL